MSGEPLFRSVKWQKYATDEYSPDELERVALEAYFYAYPLVLMEITRRQMTNPYENGQYKAGYGPMNTFVHYREYPDANFREVVRPNFDTLYSISWLDLEKEPVVLSVPDTAGRYYLLPMLDMYTDIFAAPGSRTSGNAAQNFAVISTSFSGKLPDGLVPIVAPTDHVWIVGRTKTDGPQDYAAVHKVQDGFCVTPLSCWGTGQAPPAPKPSHDPSVDMKTPPMVQVQQMSAEAFFGLAAQLMSKHPPHASDGSALLRFMRLGFVPSPSFTLASLAPAAKEAMETATKQSHPLMVKLLPTLAKVHNGWQMNIESMGVYGNSYVKRAIVARIGLGANQQQDAIYPLNLTDADGNQMTGDKKYMLHFDKASLPPVDAFWSITMYDEEGFQVANPINRFCINQPGDTLNFASDGSLDLYIQHESPGKDRESNWLPAPSSGKLGVTLRLYAPKVQCLTGEWNPPAVVCVP